jgi:hypothetical protein
MATDAPERVVNHDAVPIYTRMSTASGSLSSPVPATAEEGWLLTEWLVDRLIAVIDEEFPRDGDSGPGRRQLGVPFDSGTSYRPGARFGPMGVRRRGLRDPHRDPP